MHRDFDFEAAKIDMRLFDICLGVTNCFASWKPGFEGYINIDRMKAFLDAYNNRLKSPAGRLSPLNEAEYKYLIEVLQLSNLYMVQWCGRVFHSDMTRNPYEFYFYLHHQIGCIQWIEGHKEMIISTIR